MGIPACHKEIPVDGDIKRGSGPRKRRKNGVVVGLGVGGTGRLDGDAGKEKRQLLAMHTFPCGTRRLHRARPGRYTRACCTWK